MKDPENNRTSDAEAQIRAKLAEQIFRLSPRLARVTALASMGFADKETAARTGLSLATVRTYKQQIYLQIDVHNQSELGDVFSEARRAVKRPS